MSLPPISSTSHCSSPSLASSSPSQSISEAGQATPHQSPRPAGSRRTSTKSRSERLPHGGGIGSAPFRRMGSGLEPETASLPPHPGLPLVHPQQLHYQTFQDIPAPSIDGPSDEEDEFSEISDWSRVIKVLFGLAAVMIVIWLFAQFVLAATAWSS